MKLSDAIADMILNMFDDNTSTIQIQRNDLAQQLGCVPSQINYVITSRFTPEQGYRIESRRGGGGYIMITRAATKENALMSLVNSIGNSIDEKSAKANIYNLHYQGLLSDKAGRIMMSVVSDNNFKGVETEIKNQIFDIHLTKYGNTNAVDLVAKSVTETTITIKAMALARSNGTSVGIGAVAIFYNFKTIV